jgi:glycosyltransferase involved in cell wall biosynthesis
MRIVMIHEADEGRGGGIIATHRLHLGLRKAGIESKILCKHKRLDSLDTIAFPQSNLLSKIEPQLKKITVKLGLNDIHCLSTFQLRRELAYLAPDILHIHGIHSGFFNYLALPSLAAGRPTVLTLHDMWPLTGHCSHSFDCDRWKVGCGNCPHPDFYPAIQRDNTRLEWRLKRWAYHTSKIVIVTISNWLTELAKQSMLSSLRSYQIPSGVDTDIFAPLDKEECRRVLGISAQKKILMFAAFRVTQNGWVGFLKGGDLLVKALQGLPESLKRETVLLLLGEGGDQLSSMVGIDTRNFGYVSNDRLKTICYSAADVFILPTRAEAGTPLVLLESMACGTPMVSFNTGGVPDLVRPGVTGCLANPENVREFRDCVIQLLDDSRLRNEMGQQCRAIALKEYTLDLHVQRYIELYHQMLRDQSLPY